MVWIQFHLSDPAGHNVCAGRPVVQVEDDHAQDDGEGDEDHGEHDIVDDNWDAKRRLGDLVSQQEHEDSQGNEDGNGKSHLLPCRQTSKLL